MTLRYSHLAPSHKAKAVDILDSTINGRSPAQLLHDPMKNEKGVNRKWLTPWFHMVGDAGFEPATPAVCRRFEQIL